MLVQRTIMGNPISVPDLLAKAQPGDVQSMATLLPLVYEELRKLAGSYMNEHRPGDGRNHTLQPTALVHEAFIKMVGQDKGWSGRDHFMAVAATAMRQVLVDHSRRAKTDKRGGDGKRADVSVEGFGDNPAESTREMRVLELDDLLNELSKSGERVARVAEMRLFGGMEQDQIARVLGITRMTVHRDWQIARAWLAAKVQDSRHG